MARLPKHDRASKPIPAHPYRDSALLYGFLALVILGLTLLTGGAVPRALLVASGFWIAATGWSAWQFRTRIKARHAAASTPDADE